MNKDKAVIYARVSTADQENSRQIAELQQYAKAMNYEIVEIYQEKVSGAKLAADRPAMDAMLQVIEQKEVKHVLVWDLSRFSRNTKDALDIIELLNYCCCSLKIKGFNYLSTLDKDCKPDPMATMFLQILLAVYEMERKSIRSRMKSGYDHYLNNGGKVGRAAGYVKPIDQIKYFTDIKRNLKANLSLRKTQAILNQQGKKTSLGTIIKVQQYLLQTEKAI